MIWYTFDLETRLSTSKFSVWKKSEGINPTQLSLMAILSKYLASSCCF